MNRKAIMVTMTSTIQTDTTLPTTPTESSATAYIVIVVSTGCVILTLIAAGILWRRYFRNLSEAKPETSGGNYDYAAEVEAEPMSRMRTKDRRKEQRKNRPASDQATQRELGLELVTIDTAPDIITAHDSESIYETLDGRRAARASRENQRTSQLIQQLSQSATNPVIEDSEDSLYDHLHRFKSPHHVSPLKRVTDPQLSPRPRFQLPPRAAHSTDGMVQGRGKTDDSTVDSRRKTKTCGSCSPPPAFRSSLTELARHNSARGKRIVCQLTMVGVVEDGKPLPVQQHPAGSALFVLEPRGLPEEVSREVSFSSHPELRIEREAPEGTGAIQSADAQTRRSEYFVLEPLDKPGNLPDFARTPERPPFPTGEMEDQSCNPRSGCDYGVRCSVHGRCAVSTFPNVVEGEEFPPREPLAFRDSRFHFCPTENADDSPELPPRNQGYRRSFSLPQSSEPEPSSDSRSLEEKLSAESLKIRIKEEMRALGFLGDEDSESQDYEKAVVRNKSTPRTAVQKAEVTCLSSRSCGNEYFILEPEDKDAHDTTVCLTATPSAENVLVPNLRPSIVNAIDVQSKPRYQRQQTQGLPPRLPQRNPRIMGHARSRSETSKPSPSKYCSEQDQGEGPVVVSLRKSTMSGDKEKAMQRQLPASSLEEEVPSGSTPGSES